MDIQVHQTLTSGHQNQKSARRHRSGAFSFAAIVASNPGSPRWTCPHSFHSNHDAYKADDHWQSHRGQFRLCSWANVDNGYYARMINMRRRNHQTGRCTAAWRKASRSTFAVGLYPDLKASSPAQRGHSESLSNVRLPHHAPLPAARAAGRARGREAGRSGGASGHLPKADVIEDEQLFCTHDFVFGGIGGRFAPGARRDLDVDARADGVAVRPGG